jgi:hypothetical protein
MRWFLLASTIVSLYVTLESLDTIDYLRKNPNKLSDWLWGSKKNSTLNKLPTAHKTYLENKLTFWAVMLPIFVTLFLAKATYEAFF